MLNFVEGTQSISNESRWSLDLEALHARILWLYRFIGEEDSEVCAILMDDAAIQELNLEWRGIDAPTDVLSFPMREGEDPEIAKTLPLGDIAISVETAEAYVKSQEHRARLEETPGISVQRSWTLLDELSFLLIHATLHLLGHDHAEPKEEAEMRVLERQWMDALWEAFPAE